MEQIGQTTSILAIAMNQTIILMMATSIVASYMTILSFKYPVIGIDLEKNNDGTVVVNNIYEFGWAKQHNIPSMIE